MQQGKPSQHKYEYVYSHKQSGKWEAKVARKYLGLHTTKEKAAAAVEKHLRQVVGTTLQQPRRLPHSCQVSRWCFSVSGTRAARNSMGRRD